MPVDIEVGGRGQFDVVADGEVVASRATTRGGGFPEGSDAVAAVREHMKSRGVG